MAAGGELPAGGEGDGGGGPAFVSGGEGAALFGALPSGALPAGIKAPFPRVPWTPPGPGAAFPCGCEAFWLSVTALSKGFPSGLSKSFFVSPELNRTFV